jgi:DNA-directed RNA polymerase subunit RPC12/RpoP
MKIELNCSACGENRFSLDRELTDQSNIRCEECGHRIGTFRELKDRVAELVIGRAGRRD